MLSSSLRSLLLSVVIIGATVVDSQSTLEVTDFSHMELEINAGGMSGDHEDWVCCGVTGASRQAGMVIHSVPEDKNGAFFMSHRHGKGKDSTFNYTIPLPEANMPYRVDLGFAETNADTCRAGGRIFNVYVQDQLVLPDFDVYEEASQSDSTDGGCQTAIVKSFVTMSNEDGEVFVGLADGKEEHPMISYIAILSSPQLQKDDSNPDEAADSEERSVMYINAGGGDEDKTLLLQGVSRTAGTSAAVDISDLPDDRAYTQTPFQTNRWGKSSIETDPAINGDFSYVIPSMAQTLYRIEIGFAELHVSNCIAGARVFDVAIQNEVILKDFDVYDEVGCDKALVKSFFIEADRDGQIRVDFLNGRSDRPFVAFIEVFLEPITLVKYIDAGSATNDRIALVRSDGNTEVGAKPVEIQGVSDEDDSTPFQTHRYGLQSDFAYVIDGLKQYQQYRVKLGFAEITERNCDPGSRVFDVKIQDEVVLSDFDVAASAPGCNRAVVKKYTRMSDGEGRITVELIQGEADYPMISLIEVYSVKSRSGASRL